MTKQPGFSLIELAITVGIIMIIGFLAFPSYQSYVRKGNRSEAVSTLLKIQLAEEQYRANNAQYGTLAQVFGGVGTTPTGRYTLAISNITATTYTLTAAATGTQAQDAEGATACTPLALAVSGSTETKSPAVCWQ